MKDIVLWQTAAARERQESHLRTLAMLHRTATPPNELLLPVPRTLRWKKSLKFTVGFDVVIFTSAVCVAIWCGLLVTQLYNEAVRNIRSGNEKMQRYAAQTIDAERKAKIEKSIRDGEELERKWDGLYVELLVAICMGTLAGPTIHVGVSWFKHIRPELLVLRDGSVSRANVVHLRRWFVLVPTLEFAFTTERGEHIRRTQPISRVEASLFNIGDTVWVLYLPRRPKLARVYGLKSQIADVEIG